MFRFIDILATMGAKMYKVWNSTRMVKKSLVASSLRELQRKGEEFFYSVSPISDAIAPFNL